MAKIEQKKVVVDEIKDKLSKATSVVLVDAKGLTVEQDTALRKQLREAGVDYKVYKNRLMNLAVKDTAYEGLSVYFEGPSAMAVCYEDPTVAASILSKFMKNAKALEFKGSIIEGNAYDAKGTTVIAEIPSRDVLLSRLFGSFKSPVASFARLINAIAEKNGEASASEEAPAPAEA